MATCKDCLHWNACKAMLEAAGGIRIADDFKGSADRCKNFVSAASVAPRAEVAREIFEEIRKIGLVTRVIRSGNIIYDVTAEYTALQKKYTEPEPPKGD